MTQYFYAIDTTIVDGNGVAVGQTSYDLLIAERLRHGVVPIETDIASLWFETTDKSGIYTTRPVGIGTSTLISQLTVTGSGTTTTQLYVGASATISRLYVSGISTFDGVGSSYQKSTGKITGPGNQLNTPSNASISIDLSQSMVSIGTIGREPIWNFTNVSSVNSRMATVTIVGIASGSTVSMGRTYTVDGGSNRGINWTTISVPTFDTTNWSVLTFRIVNDDVGVSSVFANKS